MDAFPQIINFFYRKVTQTHPLKPQLLKKLQTLLHSLKQNYKHASHESHSRPNSLQDTSLRVSKRQQLCQNETVIRKGGEQWGCQWYLVAAKLSKILAYVIMHSLIASKNVWNFHKLEEQLNVRLQNAHFGESVIRQISHEWSKLGQLIGRGKSGMWQNVLVQSMKKLPQEFDQMILQCFKQDLVFSENTIEGVQQYLKQISFQLKIRINYFELDCKRIVSNELYGLSETEYNVGWVGSIKKYVLSDKIPEVTQANRKKMNVLGQFKVNIAELVKEFDENGRKLFELSDINAYGSAEEKIMSFINGKN